jgi:hypothetical protein
MARRATLTILVRYVSPFGSPANMTEEEAGRHLTEDTACWQEWAELGLLDERMLRVGTPRIERQDDPPFRANELPVWEEPSDDSFDLIRTLVRQAESKARCNGEVYVVAERGGRYATFPKRYVIEGDDVRWETR